MIKLLTATEFSDLKNISKKIDVSRINEAIDLSQSIDLYDFLGDFLFDVVENRDEASYQDLLNGSSFTISGKTYTHAGIKSLLADLVYSRYLYTSNINDTPFGLVNKLSNDSTPIDRNLIRDLVKRVQMDASIKFSIIDKYINQNITSFDRYSTGNNPNFNVFSQRITII